MTAPRNQNTDARFGTVVLGLFLLVMGVGLVAALFSLWPAIEAATAEEPTSTPWSFLGLSSWTLTPNTALLVLVAVVGGLGSLIHGATSFVSFVGNRRLMPSWYWWYVLRILAGATLAVLVYFVFRGGFLTGTATTEAVNPYGIAAIAGLAGLFSKQAVDKLREVFDTLLRVREGAGDDARADKMVAPPPVLQASDPNTVQVGQTDVMLTLTGNAFTDDSRVSVRRLPSKTEPATEPMELRPAPVAAGRLSVVLPNVFTATVGAIEVTVVNPAPIRRSASLTIVVVE